MEDQAFQRFCCPGPRSGTATSHTKVSYLGWRTAAVSCLLGEGRLLRVKVKGEQDQSGACLFAALCFWCGTILVFVFALAPTFGELELDLVEVVNVGEVAH